MISYREDVSLKPLPKIMSERLRRSMLQYFALIKDNLVCPKCEKNSYCSQHSNGCHGVECRHWTFQKSETWCFLKTSNANKSASRNNDFISGNRACGCQMDKDFTYTGNNWCTPNMLGKNRTDSPRLFCQFGVSLLAEKDFWLSVGSPISPRVRPCCWCWGSALRSHF